MATASPAPQKRSEKVLRLGELHGLGRFRRALPRGKTSVFGKRTVTAHVYEFEKGIVHAGEDKVLRAYPWAEVVEVYSSSIVRMLDYIYMETRFGFTLILGDGRMLTLTGVFKDPARRSRKQREKDEREKRVYVDYEIYKIMSSAASIVSRARLPHAVAALNRGEELDFGDVQLSLRGLQTGNDIVPWSSVKAVQVMSGVIRIEKEGGSSALSRLPVDQVPNVELFVNLAEALRSGGQE